MKKILLFAISFCFTVFLNAQVSKTASVTTGGLKTILTVSELSTITNLSLSGAIDARDFKIMRHGFPNYTYYRDINKDFPSFNHSSSITSLENGSFLVCNSITS